MLVDGNVIAFMTSVTFPLLASVAVAFLVHRYFTWTTYFGEPSSPLLSSESLLAGSENKAVLLVIAHPDDETMFFAPTLLSLASATPAVSVHVLCLSTGNADGLGKVRQAELMTVCETSYGIPAKNVAVLDIPELQDGPQHCWSTEVISEQIDSYVASTILKQLDLQTTVQLELLTFDHLGVSKHPNHIRTSLGAEQWFHSSQGRAKKLCKRANVSLSLLETISEPSKFLWFLGSPTWLPEQRQQQGQQPEAETRGSEKDTRVFLRTNQHIHQVYQAMAIHQSQFKWYRKMFILLSRYSYINTLRVKTISWANVGQSK